MRRTLRELRLPLVNEVSDRSQQLSRSSDSSQSIKGSAMHCDELGPGCFQSINRGIGGFPRTSVLARSFAEVLSGCGHIQQIVSNLKQQAETSGEFSDRSQLMFVSPGNHRPAARRGSNQRAGFL